MTHSRTRFVAAVAALLVLTSTGAVAATLTANSVRSVHIKNGQVKGVDLATRSVTSVKVKDGSLTAADFAADTLPSGPQGPAGPAGPPGPAGPVDADQVVDVPRTLQVPLTSLVSCPAGAAPLAPIDFTESPDARPDFGSLDPTSGEAGLALVFDAVSGEEDTESVCATVQVPVDWVSGAVVFVRLVKASGTGLTERLTCPIRINSGTDNLQDATVNIGGPGLYQCPVTLPAGNLSGSSLVVRIGLENADQPVRVQSVAVRYIAAS